MKSRNAWSHRVNFKYYRSHMDNWRPFKLSLEMHGASWSRMEAPCIFQIVKEPYEDHLNEV